MRLQHAWFVVIGIIPMAHLAAVAPYIVTITECLSIHFADELFNPASDIVDSVE